MRRAVFLLASGLAILFVIMLVVQQAAPRPLPLQSQKARVTWTPDVYETVVFNGTGQSVNFQFTSSNEIPDISLFVVPEISRFLSLQPIRITKALPGENYSIQGRLEIPKSVSPQTYEGTIHVRSGQRTIPATLKIVIHVAAPSASFVPTKPASPSQDRITLYKGQLQIINDELVVVLRPNTVNPERRIQEIAVSTKAVIIGALPLALTYQLRFQIADVDSLNSMRSSIEDMPDVESANLQFSGGPLKVPNDAEYDEDRDQDTLEHWDESNPTGNNWALEYIRAPSGYQYQTLA